MAHPTEEQESGGPRLSVLSLRTPNPHKQCLLGARLGSGEAASKVFDFLTSSRRLSTEPRQLVGVFEPEPRRSGSAARKGLFKPNTELMSAHNSFCSLDGWAQGPAGTGRWATWTSDFTSLDLQAGGRTAGQVRPQGPAIWALGSAGREGPRS